MSQQATRALVPRQPWVTAVTADAVRHFAWGIGDDNPMWYDSAQADGSRWGGLIAPPCLFYAVHETTVAPGHEPARRLYTSVEWVWHDVAPVGTLLQSSATSISENGTPAGIEQVGQVRFTADGRHVATARTTCLRTTTAAVSSDERAEIRYSSDQLADLEATILAEHRTGAGQLVWEDVAAGTQLGPLLKGPLSIMDVVAWCAATQGVAQPADGYSEGGLHAATATGPQQVAWIAHLLSDWVGDNGFLHRLAVDIDTNPALGTTTSITAAVTGKAIVGAVAFVDLDVSATDQAGALSARGTAQVALPSRDSGPVTTPIGGDSST